MQGFYIVSYDVADDERRQRLAKALEGFGERRQRSVFECHLREADFRRLWQRAAEIIDPGEDSVLCYPLCQACVKKVLSLGVGDPILDEPGYFIV